MSLTYFHFPIAIYENDNPFIDEELKLCKFILNKLCIVS